MKDDYAFRCSCGTLMMADFLSRCETNDERRKKKQRVVQQKCELLAEGFPEHAAGDVPQHPEAPLQNLKWNDDETKTFLIDLAFANPFAPYELRLRNEDVEKALINVASTIRMDHPKETVLEIVRTQKAALRAHREINWKKAAMWGAGGALVCAIGGWVVAPMIGTSIGTAAGLSGAAATSHGLAILGGGSLAIGGSGMAGGMWLVTGVGASLGGAGGLLGRGGTEFLIKLGAAQARTELLKLQVSYKVVQLGKQVQLAKAQRVTTKLAEHLHQLKAELHEERKLNERNSKRVRDLEGTVKAAEEALRWIEKQQPKEKGDA